MSKVSIIVPSLLCKYASRTIEDKRSNVYIIIDPISLLPRYVGITCNPAIRFRGHLKDNKDTYKCRWIKSLLRKHQSPIFKILHRNLTKEEAKQKEIQIIKEYKNLGYPLTNSTLGGEGTFGWKMPEIVKQKIRLMKLGKPSPRKGVTLTEDIKRKISESRKGKPSSRKGVKLSEETKEKLSKARKGKQGYPHTDEFKRKLSERMIGKKIAKGCKRTEFYKKEKRKFAQTRHRISGKFAKEQENQNEQ